MIEPCPHCGRKPTVDLNGEPTVSCDNCYDGAPDSTTRHDFATAASEQAAIEGWNKLCRNQGAHP